MSRPEINITPVERVARGLVGLVGLVVGVAAVLTADSAVTVGLSVLLAAFGLDMIVTGALGHCPLYKALGHVPNSLRGAS